jgi:hypothetical protein
MRAHANRILPLAVTFAMGMLAPGATHSAAQQSESASESKPSNFIGIGKWVTFTANFPEAGYRKTDFFAPAYNTSVFQWDSRVAFWLPPSPVNFSWGPYVRLAGIAESQTAAYPNAWLGGPGVGFQIYPFSSRRFQQPTSMTGKVLGPLRLFAEYARTDYWGAANTWRPRRQTQIGLDYWKAVNVNNPDHAWWLEVWNGAYWLASNEFTSAYDSVQVASSWRSGIRTPHTAILSALTPYFAIQSSRTKYDRAGTRGCVFASPTAGPNPCDFYWENGLVVGGGIRVAPSLCKTKYKEHEWLSRFVVYAEYLDTATYYGPAAPSSVPRYDIHAGVSASLGNWYNQAPSCPAKNPLAGPAR